MMMDNFLENFLVPSKASVILPPVTSLHESSIIFLHKAGDGGNELSSLFGKLRPDQSRAIFPTAPVSAVPLSGGLHMTSWFHVGNANIFGEDEDEKSIENAYKLVVSLIEKEKSEGVAPNRILLGGVGQGGALAVYAALRYVDCLAGVIMISAWLPLHKKFPDFASGAKGTPIFQIHGEQDDVIPFEWALESSKLLSAYVTDFQFKRFPYTGHEITAPMIKDISAFIQRCLPPLPSPSPQHDSSPAVPPPSQNIAHNENV